MKPIPSKSNTTHLIWLVSLTLMFSVGIFETVGGFNVPLRNIKQTEIALTAHDQKINKASHPFFTQFSAKRTSHFTFDLALLTRITYHTQEASDNWKTCELHTLSSTPKTGQAHTKICETGDEDSSLLKG